MYIADRLQSFYDVLSHTVPTELLISFFPIGDIQDDVQAFLIVGAYCLGLLMEFPIEKMSVFVGFLFAVALRLFVFLYALTVVSLQFPQGLPMLLGTAPFVFRIR